MKPGQLFTYKGRFFWVVDKPHKVRESDFAEWEKDSIPMMTVTAAGCDRAFRSNLIFVSGDDDELRLGRLLFVRELDALTFEMRNALKARRKKR